MTLVLPDKDYWDKLYTSDQYAYGTEPNVYLQEQAFRLRSGMKALALADGEGRNGVWLAEQGLTVLSVDYSPAGIEKARLLAAQRKVSLTCQCRDIVQWDWPEQRFDVVAAMYLHLAAPERKLVHGNIIRALKPGGLLILEAFHRRQLGRFASNQEAADIFYTTSMLNEDFRRCCILELLEGDVLLEEGYMHQGQAAVVRLLARK